MSLTRIEIEKVYPFGDFILIEFKPGQIVFEKDGVTYTLAEQVLIKLDQEGKFHDPFVRVPMNKHENNSTPIEKEDWTVYGLVNSAHNAVEKHIKEYLKTEHRRMTND